MFNFVHVNKTFAAQKHSCSYFSFHMKGTIPLIQYLQKDKWFLYLIFKFINNDQHKHDILIYNHTWSQFLDLYNT